MNRRRILAGAVLLDFAVSPLFIWDTFTASFARDLEVSETRLSLVFAIGLAAFTTGVLLGGRVADVVPPRALALVTAGGVVTGLGLAGAATSLPVLIVGFGVVLGGTTGLGYATAVRVAGTATARRGRAVGIVVSAYAAGAVVLAPLAAQLLAVAGRAATFAVLAGGLGVALACAAALLPGASQPRSRHTVGWTAHANHSPVPALWTMFFLGSAPALVAFAHAGEFAGGPEMTVVAVSLLNAGNFAGRLIAGPASDRVGRAHALYATVTTLGAACIALALSDWPPVTLAALLVLGTQYGAISALTPITTASSVPAERFGTTYGKVFSGWGLAGLSAPVASAWLAIHIGYQGVAGVLVGVSVLAGWATVWGVTAVGRAART